MNIALMNNIIKKPPLDDRAKYIFVNDNKAICEQIITVKYRSVYIAAENSNGYFSVESFCEWIRDSVYAGTDILQYVFVLSCFRKRTNDMIMSVLENNMISYRSGAYTLFKDKEYLGKYEKQGELEQALEAYVRRYEGDSAEIVDHMRFCRIGADGAVKGILDLEIVRYLMETVCMFVIGRELYVYRGGVYVLDCDCVYIKSIIQRLIPDRFVTYRNLGAVCGLLIDQQDLQKTLEDLNNYPPWWINFQNGMFDVKEWKLWKHRPEYMSVNQIPHELDMSLQREGLGTETGKFLATSIPNADDRYMLWQYIGYCMTRDTSLQKMLIIRGIGGTGKSRIINLIQEIVGSRNYSNISLQDLNQKFYPSMLFGKLLNACADISSDALTSVDNIKKATGEDVMIYEKKNKDPQSFRSYAKLIFSANKIPLNLDEKSNAFYRRLLILEMNIAPDKPDPALDDKLRQEIGGSIWEALGHLKKMYEQGSISESRSSREQVEELHRAADTVKAFLDECTEHKPGARIARKLLYEEYVTYCKACGRKEHSSNPFYKNLEEKGYRCKRTADNRYILDIQLKDEGFLPDEEETGRKVFKNDRFVTGL